jgi:hypothetical protein
MTITYKKIKNFSLSKSIKKSLDIRYVYVIYLPEISKLKIGITISMANRMAQIEDDFGEVRVLSYLKFFGAEAVEQGLHKYFKEYHSPEPKGSGAGRTELFDIPFYFRWKVLFRLWRIKLSRFVVFAFFVVVVFVFWKMF